MQHKKYIINFIEEHWQKRSFTSFLLLPIALLFSLLLIVRRYLYTKGLYNQFKPKAKIISVGNLTMGGNGKTPFVIFLAKYLKNKGFTVAVSHRCYKGKFENDIRIISDQKKVYDLAQEAGDEPLMLSNNLPNITIVVGKNRTEAIKLVEEKLSPDYIILDDSFQHLKVKHDVDIVLFNAQNPLGNKFVFPAGMLREPINALHDVNLLVLNNWLEGFQIPAWMGKYKKPIIKTIYNIEFLQHYYKDMKIETGLLKEKNIFLLSGIGNPYSFERSMEEVDIPFKEHYIFPDHHKFQYNKDIMPIEKKAFQENVDTIITTEKDYVKLKSLPIRNIEFYYAKLQIQVLGLKEIDKLVL